jgi:hypothetical protein
MQALSIYLIIKVGEGPTDYDNGLDSLLVAVVVVSQLPSLSPPPYKNPSQQMQALSTQMGGRIGDATFDNGKLDTRWDNWIFEESKRR